MLAEVRKCAEAHDIKGLRYIFVDSLDVDPTFEKYKEDYEYCKSIQGLFDEHQELNGILADESRWTSEYWEQLKLDLMKNFSLKRFEHMIAVAQVVYADKITRLRKEREADIALGKNSAPHKPLYNQAGKPGPSVSAPRPISEAQLQEKRLAEKRRELEAHNRKVEAEVAAKQAARQARIEAEKRSYSNGGYAPNGSTGSKKVVGIVLAIVLLLGVLLIITALL